MKEYNRKLFLRLLRTAAMSRSEVARHMGVTQAATAKIAEELLQEGYVAITAGARVGRASAPLMLREDCAYAVGVYLNRDGCSVGLVDICGHTLEECRLHLTGNVRIQDLAQSIRQMVTQHQIPWQKIVGVGISAPGPLDGEQGTILNPPRFDLWHNVPLGGLLEKELDIPVYLENNASRLARFNQGKPEAKGSENFLLLLVDSGVGSGVISDGKVLKGAGYFTSELGQTSIDHQGRPCACGNVGCLETYAAIPNLLKDTKFDSWKAVIDSLPDPEADALLCQEATYLAAGIVTLTNTISIDTVLLMGDILYGVESLAPMLEEIVNRRNMRRNILSIRVCPGCTGENILAQAAADIAFGRFLTV